MDLLRWPLRLGRVHERITYLVTRAVAHNMV